jgi:hypothetical protein
LLGKGKGSKPQPYRNSHRAWSHTRKSQKYWDDPTLMWPLFTLMVATR